jgi:hypothetical protein
MDRQCRELEEAQVAITSELERDGAALLEESRGLTTQVPQPPRAPPLT